MPNIIDGPGTQNFSNRSANAVISMVIVHSMGELLRSGSDTCTAIERLTLKAPPPTWAGRWSRVSAHYYIEPNGTIIKIIDPDLRAWHAGKSAWGGTSGLNDCSIGFELAVAGTHNYASFLQRIRQSDCYSPAQYEAAGWLTARLILRYDIPLDRIRGHSEVSGPDVRPDPKFDPGDGFSWRDYYGWITHYVVREAPL